jgi:NAD(P)-dependent dehydrogenase (short-subunit alcohol dehydrogenase family)
MSLATPSTPVVITGGASGIGLASAEALAEIGRPVALWDIDGAKAANAAQAITARFGTPATGIAIDLRDLGAIEPALAATRKAIGAPGGLVHAAGIVDTDSLDGMTAESWDSGIAIHLRALAFITQAIRADLAACSGSAIVAIASINATLGNAVNPIYSAAKGGILSLVRSLADRLAMDGIRINSVSPGQIMTPMMQPSVDALPDGYFEKRILLGRLGEAGEVGRVVRFLLSDEASYITASEIVVDGGNISSQRG